MTLLFVKKMKSHLLLVELGLTLDFDIAAELARIDAKKQRRPARTAGTQLDHLGGDVRCL